MNHNYYIIEPDLNDDNIAYINDWEFTYWPNKPSGEVVQNPDGTFSVVMEQNFIPLVTQLQNLFQDGKNPENGTYLGEAVLAGKNEPFDCIYGNFINQYQGLVISKKLLKIIEKYDLSEHFIYELPLIKIRKKYNDYFYIYFSNFEFGKYDMQLINDGNMYKICVNQIIKEDIEYAGIKGCKFTLVKESLS